MGPPFARYLSFGTFRLVDTTHTHPPGGIIGAAFSFGFSAIMASVVKSSDATEAAFCSAVLATLVGSMMPASCMSST